MEKSIRVLIVEDEFVTLDLLRDYVERAGYEVSGDAMSAPEAIAILERFDTDLAILDIRIRGEHDGVWLANQIREQYNIPFIFLTANSDVANVRRATEAYPYGYLVKPFSEVDIMAAIEVAIKRYEKERSTTPFKPVSVQKMELPEDASIFLKDNQTYRKVLVREILYIQAFKNYLEIVLVGDAPVVLRSTMYKFMEVLPKSVFRQVHRSFVVSMHHVSYISNDYLLLKEKKIPIGESYRADFLKAFQFFG